MSSRLVDMVDNTSGLAGVRILACKSVPRQLNMISNPFGTLEAGLGYIHPPSEGKRVSCRKGAGHKPPSLDVEVISDPLRGNQARLVVL